MTRPGIHNLTMQFLDRLWNRNLPPNASVALQTRWPLILLPIAFINQILTPHPAWVVILVALLGLYLVSLLWVRGQVQSVDLSRTREGTIQVVGDSISERFELTNRSPLPLLWAEILDESTVPGYRASQVVACPSSGSYGWRTVAECRRRGVYRLGPSRLRWGDPFGLFTAECTFPHGDTVIIYPRVLHLPPIQLPHGNTSGVDRRRRPLLGNSRATSVREYQPGDSLRYIHWPTTAHRNTLMVTELDAEPGGDVWIVLDLNSAAHQGEDEESTLEFAIIVAASLAAELLNSAERQAVGLITTSGLAAPNGDAMQNATPFIAMYDGEAAERPVPEAETIIVQPQPGPAQLWRILAALAPVQASPIPLAQLLQSSQDVMRRGRVLAVITPDADTTGTSRSVDRETPASGHDSFDEQRALQSPESSTDGSAGVLAWMAELVHLQSRGTSSGVTVIAPADSTPGGWKTAENEQEPGAAGPRSGRDDGAYTQLRSMLARYDTPIHVLHTGMPLRPALTFRRTRTVIRSTPTGGAISVEVEEEVG